MRNPLVIAALIAVSVLLFPACQSGSDPGWDGSAPFDASGPDATEAATSDGARPPADAASAGPLAHLPGTLLRDDSGRLWMVGPWLDRSLVTFDEVERTNLDPATAILMSAEEERCLPVTGHEWRGRQGWELVVINDGSYWYLNRIRQFRRIAPPAVMRSWRDDPMNAATLDISRAAFAEDCRDLGPMGFPDGAFVQSGDLTYYVLGGAFHLISADLARAMGYDPGRAVYLQTNTLWEYGPTGAPIVPSAFTVCPATAPRGHRDDDEDGDGVTLEHDCDDRNPRTGPGFAEWCDGMDNNCDGIIDDGFRIQASCELDDACRTPGTTVCSDDQRGIVCFNEDADCRR